MRSLITRATRAVRLVALKLERAEAEYELQYLLADQTSMETRLAHARQALASIDAKIAALGGTRGAAESGA